MRRGVLLSAVCVLLVAAIGWLLGGLPLRIVVDGLHATAHMELLGEYPNDVKLIELEQLATSQVVWRAVATREMVQLHQVLLVVGANTAALRTFWGRARTEIPAGSSEFMLLPDTEYRFRVCPPSWWRRCVSETFQIKRM
jgi:hypothetical protein